MELNVIEQIKRARDFIEEYYYNTLQENLRKGQKFLIVDYQDLCSFDPDMADELINNPEDIIIGFEKAIEQFDIENSSGCKIRIKNLNPSNQYTIGEIRKEVLGKFVCLGGFLLRKSVVRPRVTSCRFECPDCGNIMNILQLETSFKEPTRCGCGRKGKFALLDKELIDVQSLVIQEKQEELEGSAQPQRIDVLLKEDLVAPIKEKKTNPGCIILINGIVKEVPVMLRTGEISTTYNIMVEANYVEIIGESFEDILITKEQEEKIKEVAKRDPLKLLVEATAPTIFGHEKLKEAVTLQLFGGVRKVLQDERVVRGDSHILIIGDPGCIGSDELIFMNDGTLRRISSLGLYNEEKINYKILVDRYNPSQSRTDKAVTFFKYSNQKTKIITTQTGKQLTCSYNHPLYVKNDGKKYQWITAENLSKGDKIKVIKNVTSQKSSYCNFQNYSINYSSNKTKIIPPCNEDVGLLYGYIIGDGCVTKSDGKNYNRITLCINQDEKDLIGIFYNIFKKEFFVKSYLFVRHPPISNYIFGRKIYPKEPVFHLVVNSKTLGSIFQSATEKKVPQIILSSKKSVVASFLKGLFEADGCVFVAKRKNRTNKGKIQLKSSNPRLLQDILILLIRFGIQARINSTNLIIARSDDIISFKKNIGFISIKKQKKLKHVVDILTTYPRRKRKPLGYEKIKKIEEGKVQTVYDIEVATTHRFISNGIISHNSAKTALIKALTKLTPKWQYVSGGGGASGVGIAAAVVKDDFFKGGFTLDAGAGVLAHNGMLFFDELDKMKPEERSALHEIMESQCFTVHKAGINATLMARATVLAAANPKYGRFDPNAELYTQLELPPTLINRFDLVFALKDRPDAASDDKMARHILKSHRKKLELDQLSPNNPFFDRKFAKVYIAFAKTNIFPELTDEAEELIHNYYTNLRKQGNPEEEGRAMAVPINARYLEGIIRIGEQSAKARLSIKVTKEDAQKAIDIVDYCLRQFGYDPEKGWIDIDRISGVSVSASKREKFSIVLEIIKNCERTEIVDDSDNPAKGVPINDIISICKLKGIPAEEVESIIDKLKLGGDIYEPRAGFIQTTY